MLTRASCKLEYEIQSKALQYQGRYPKNTRNGTGRPSAGFLGSKPCHVQVPSLDRTGLEPHRLELLQSLGAPSRVSRSCPLRKWLWFKHRYPKWLALVSGAMDPNLRIFWCVHFDPRPYQTWNPSGQDLPQEDLQQLLFRFRMQLTPGASLQSCLGDHLRGLLPTCGCGPCPKCLTLGDDLLQKACQLELVQSAQQPSASCPRCRLPKTTKYMMHVQSPLFPPHSSLIEAVSARCSQVEESLELSAFPLCQHQQLDTGCSLPADRRVPCAHQAVAMGGAEACK